MANKQVIEDQSTGFLDMMLDHMANFLETNLNLLGMSINYFEQMI
jgi:hypothetical protein